MLGSYCVLRSLTFETAISMLMGCEVISRRIIDDRGQQATNLLRILTVMQRDSIVILRQESDCTMNTCPSACMLHRTSDVYVVLAFKQTTDYLDVVPHSQLLQPDQQQPQQAWKDALLTDSQHQSQLLLQSTHLLVRRVCCTPLPQCKRCKDQPPGIVQFPESNSSSNNVDAKLGGGAGGGVCFPRVSEASTEYTLLDMADDEIFSERGAFWETASYLLGHFSHVDMCFFGKDVPPTAEEDLISLNLMPWMTSTFSSSWVRGKNSVAAGSRRQKSCYSPHFVLEMWTAKPDQPVLVAFALRQAPRQWRRANKIPVRLQVYVISDIELGQVSRRDLLELKSREQLERRLSVAHQLTHRSVFTTGSVTELLVLRQGSFLIILETGIPGDEGDFCLSVFTSSVSRLTPFQNIVDTSYEFGGNNPNASIRCREFMPVISD